MKTFSLSVFFNLQRQQLDLGHTRNLKDYFFAKKYQYLQQIQTLHVEEVRQKYYDQNRDFSLNFPTAKMLQKTRTMTLIRENTIY